MNGFKTKLIQYYLAKGRAKKNKGFTLLELLIIVIVLGILSAIAIPSLLGQVAKAKETEAKQNIATFNKYQQIYYLEKSRFTDNFNALAMGNLSGSTNSETKYYNYQLEQFDANVRIKIRAIPKELNLREYKGGIRRDVSAIGIPVIITLACRNNDIGVSNLSISIVDGTCNNGEKLYGNGV